MVIQKVLSLCPTTVRGRKGDMYGGEQKVVKRYQGSLLMVHIIQSMEKF